MHPSQSLDETLRRKRRKDRRQHERVGTESTNRWSRRPLEFASRVGLLTYGRRYPGMTRAIEEHTGVPRQLDLELVAFALSSPLYRHFLCVSTLYSKQHMVSRKGENLGETKALA
jgi:hypothetical protein